MRRLSMVLAALALSSAPAFADSGDFDVPQAMDAHRKAEFDKSGYEFCHGGFNVADPPPGTRGFCKIYDDSSVEVCPEVMKSCTYQRPWWADLALPEQLTKPLSVALIGVFLFALVHLIRKGRWDTSTPRIDLDLEQLQHMEQLPDAPARHVFGQARRALSNGALADALLLLQVCLLRHFDDRGLVAFHPSKTNGEYVRGLRGHVALQALYKDVAGQSDRLRFGDGGVDGGRIERAVADAERIVFSTSVGGGRAGAAPLMLVLALSMIPFSGCALGKTSFFSHAPNGLWALSRFLREAGYDASTVSGPLEELAEDFDLVILHRDLMSVRRDPLALDGLMDRGVPVLVLEDMNQPSDFLPVSQTGTISSSPPGSTVVASAADSLSCMDLDKLQHLEDLDAKIPSVPILEWKGFPGVAPSSRHLFTLVPVLVQAGDEDPFASPVVAYAGSRIGTDQRDLPGCLILFSSSQLFSNASLTRSNNAKAVGALIDALVRPGGKIALATSDRMTSALSSDSGRAAGFTHAGLMPFILHAGVFVALLFLAMGAAFGPLTRPVKTAHKEFVEHLRAIGRHYERAGAAGRSHVCRALSRLIVTRARSLTRSGPGGWNAAARHLAQMHELSEDEVRAALRLGMEGTHELGPPKQGDPAPGSTRMLEIVATLLSGGVWHRQDAHGARRR